MKNRARIIMGRVRELLDEQVRKFGYRFVKQSEMHGISVAALVGHLISPNEGISFLQVGAHDGITDDHLSEFRARKNWSGFLLEPNPIIFPRLERNLRETGNPNVRALQLALGQNDETLPFYVVDQTEARSYPKLPIAVDQWSSLSVDKLDVGLASWGIPGEGRSALIKKISVETISFETLLTRHSVNSLDLLSLDVEGMDGVLLSEFPLERYRPRLVICEWDKMTDEQLNHNLKRFRGNDYSWMFVGWDLVFFRDEGAMRERPWFNLNFAKANA